MVTSTNEPVAIIGCGSVGSMAALQLASAGVRHFRLLDRDTLEAANLRRHAGERSQIGQPKVRVVADQLARRFTDLSIVTRQACGVQDPDALQSTLSGAAAALVAVDNEPVKYLIDQTARRLQIPLVYCGVYGAGTGIEVIISSVRHRTPCYGCSAETAGRGSIDLFADPSLPHPAYTSASPNSTASAPVNRRSPGGRMPVPLRPWDEAGLVSIQAAAALAVHQLVSLSGTRPSSPFAIPCLLRMPLADDAATGTANWQLRRTTIPSNSHCLMCAPSATVVEPLP